VFVVTADRRKLLEFLLSSFEIAVNKSEELVRAGSTNDALRQAVTKADGVAAEQGRVIGIMNTTLQQREHAISSLNDELKDKAYQIAELIREKGFFLEEREADKALLSQTEDKLQSLTREKEEAALSYQKETGELKEHLASLTEELGRAHADLVTTKRALEEEAAGRRDSEARVTELVSAKEKLEKAIRALTLECEQARASSSQEKNRAQAAEQEIKSLIQAKTESEQDLTRIIDELKGTARQQATDLVTLKEERTADKDRISRLETQLGNLSLEKEQAECGLRKTADDLKRDLGSLRSTLDTTAVALEEKTRQAALLEQELRDQKKAAEQVQASAHTFENELKSARSDLAHEKDLHVRTKESLQGVIRERDSALSTLQGAHEEVKSDLDSHRDDLLLAKHDLAAATEECTSLKNHLELSTVQIRNLEEKLQLASGDQAESDKQVRSLADELEQVKAALEIERRQRRAGEETLRNASFASEKAEETVRQGQKEQEHIKAMLDSEREGRRNAEERLRALEVAGESRIQELTADLADAINRQKDLEEQVRTITREKLEAEKQAASLEDEIDQARSALADEWEDHMTDNERFTVAAGGEKPRERPVERMSGPGPAAAETRAVITRTSDLPMEVKESPRSVMPVQVPQEGPQTGKLSGDQDLYEDAMDRPDETDEIPEVTIVRDPAPEVTLDPILCPPVPEMPAIDNEECREPGPDDGKETEDSGHVPSPDNADETDKPVDEEGRVAESDSFSRPVPPVPGIAFNRMQWFDLLKWAHHSGALSQDQRLQIVRMGRLIQKGRKLTNKQDEQVREMIVLVQSLGYRFT
jgi:chromosome segregation ATPase